ncbi:hypothetical protein FBU59_005318, partial [Linderina macrospora]
DFIGNGLYIPAFSHPFDRSASEITGRSLAEIAVKVRSSVDAVKKHHVKDFFESVEGDSANVAASLTSHEMFKHVAILTNHVKLRVYDIDFGFGVADFVAPRPYLGRICVRILPVRPPSDSLYIFINDKPAILDSIRKNKFWGCIAKLIY